MHIIRDKKDHKVLYIDYTPSISLLNGQEVYSEFNDKTMEVGWTDKSNIPAYYNMIKAEKLLN